jgi:hypothetical protein
MLTTEGEAVILMSGPGERGVDAEVGAAEASALALAALAAVLAEVVVSRADTAGLG